MATAPFNPNENVPADDDIVSQFPAAERAFRDIMEDWINTEHDTSGHHKFPVITTAVRDGISDWVVGSQIYNTTTEAVEILTSTGPNVWSPAVATTISTGTWTPALNFGGATTGITYSRQEGTYARVGNLVRLWAHVVLTSNGSASGDATITGIPFDASPSPSGFLWMGNLNPLNTGSVTWAESSFVTLQADGTSLNMVLRFADEDAEFEVHVDNITENEVGNDAQFALEISYITDAA